MNLLNGKKTYFVAAAIAAASAARYLGYIDSDAYEAIFGLLTGTGLATLRSGVQSQPAGQ